MRILGLDLETTGLEIQKDRILKLGVALLDTAISFKQPLIEKEWTLWHTSYPPVKPDAFVAHGIHSKTCEEFGESPMEVLQQLTLWCESHEIKILMGHNSNNFDIPMIIANCDAFAPHCKSYFEKALKIDSAQDIPYPDIIQTRKLSHLAAEHGFINPFPHSALSDIRTMFEIFSRYSEQIDLILSRAKSKTITIQAGVDFHTKEYAKARRFNWDSQNQRWLKKIKECDLDKEIAEAQFAIKIVNE